MPKTKLTPPLKWHGGKGAFHGKLAAWIISHFPPHLHYVEPYFGGGSVLLARDQSRDWYCDTNWHKAHPHFHGKVPAHLQGCSEVVCDLHKDLTVFWQVLRCPTEFEMLRRLCEATDFNQGTFSKIGTNVEAPSDVDHAWRFFVRCRQSLAGRMKSFAPLTRNRTRSRMNEQVSAWLNAIEGLPQIHARMKRVVVLEPQCALQVIKKQDDDKTLFYLDPPYLQETRAAKNVYEHEANEVHHIALLALLAMIKGKFVLSGYRSDLYDQHAALHGWTRHDFEIVNNASSKKKKDIKTESIWCNFQ